MAIITMPKMGDTMQEGTISKWYKQVGDSIKEGEVIAEIETEKAAIEIEAFESGALTSIIVPEGKTVPVGEPIAEIGGSGAKTAPAAPASAEKAPEPTVSAPAPQPAPAPDKPSLDVVSNGDGERIKASPLARRIAMVNSVDLRQVHGTGPGGRIVREDVEAFLQGMGSRLAPPEARPSAPQPSVPQAQPVPTGDVWTAGKPPSRMRQIIARRLSESKQQVPHFYVTVEVNMKPAMTLREQLNARGEGYPKLSPNDIVLKALADALRADPAVRVSYDAEKTLTTDQVNIGVAVAVPDGLIVPVVRQADTKSLSAIATEVRVLAEKARAGKLLPDDYAGGTFSISNMGMFGVESFSAIINPPEPGILAIGAVEEKAVVENGQLAIGTRMKITLSCDHRVIDGAVGAKFLQDVKRRLENPLTLVS